MNNKNFLLEKYYRGETSLQEEDQLRSILTSEEKNADSCIFNAFAEEKNEKMPFSIKTARFLSQKPLKIPFYRKKWIQIASGMAACLLIVFGLIFFKKPQQPTAYVIINGVRINDKNLALQYINESFEEEERIINSALAQLYEMNHIEKELTEIANNNINNCQN